MDRHFDTREVVFAIYRFFLNREPDPEGLNHFINALNGGISVDDAMLSVARSHEFKDRLYTFFRAIE